jgi:hypothetical protein
MRRASEKPRGGVADDFWNIQMKRAVLMASDNFESRAFDGV